VSPQLIAPEDFSTVVDWLTSEGQEALQAAAATAEGDIKTVVHAFGVNRLAEAQRLLRHAGQVVGEEALAHGLD
jgi:hypothetical protein